MTERKGELRSGLRGTECCIEWASCYTNARGCPDDIHFVEDHYQFGVRSAGRQPMVRGLTPRSKTGALFFYPSPTGFRHPDSWPLK